MIAYTTLSNYPFQGSFLHTFRWYLFNGRGGPNTLKQGVGRREMKNMVRTIQASCILGLVVLSGCSSITPPSPVTPIRTVTSQDQATIHALHKRLLEREQTIALRDQQIEVMSSQLDALKRIEQDIADRRRPVRHSVIVAP